MVKDGSRNTAICLFLVGAGIFIGLVLHDTFISQSDQAVGVSERPLPYWAVVEATYDGNVVEPGPVVVSVNIDRSDPQPFRGGACHTFLIGTAEPSFDPHVSPSEGIVRLGITGLVWLPTTGDQVRTRCNASVQLSYETKISEIVAQADHWGWDGNLLTISGPRPGHTLTLRELLLGHSAN